MTGEVIFVESKCVVFVEGRTEVLFVEDRNDGFTLNLGEQGVPGASDALPGGTTGQLRAKASNANFDEIWVDPPTSGVWGQITGAITDQTDLQAQFADALAFAADQG
jgi:hypothetical protein